MSLEIKVQGINIDNQLADQLTKSLPQDIFGRDRLNTNVIDMRKVTVCDRVTNYDSALVTNRVTYQEDVYYLGYILG